jgi:hypothetical protein
MAVESEAPFEASLKHGDGANARGAKGRTHSRTDRRNPNEDTREHQKQNTQLFGNPGLGPLGRRTASSRSEDAYRHDVESHRSIGFID